MPIPETWEGKSLLQTQTEEFVFQHMGKYHSILHFQNNTIMKYIIDEKSEKEELYNLSNDLWETKNLIEVLSLPYIDSLRNRMTIMLH